MGVPTFRKGRNTHAHRQDNSRATYTLGKEGVGAGILLPPRIQSAEEKGTGQIKARGGTSGQAKGKMSGVKGGRGWTSLNARAPGWGFRARIFSAVLARRCPCPGGPRRHS